MSNSAAHYNTQTPLSCQVEEQQKKVMRKASKQKSKGKSAVFDTAATSSCGMEGDDFIPTDEPSGKVFFMPTGDSTSASTKAKLHHEVREPARTVDMVPELKQIHCSVDQNLLTPITLQF